MKSKNSISLASFWQAKKRWAKGILWTFLALFLFMNVIAFFHAYKFTHFDDSSLEKTKDAKSLTTWQKIKTLLLGVNNPRPQNSIKPFGNYETITLKSNKTIECWYFKTHKAKGTVILFHGYGGNKSFMLNKSDVFLKLGYNTLLVDFMGAGGSEGNQTSIGYFEAEQVKTCFDYLSKQGEKNIILYGNSMGAVATMRAVSECGVRPKGMIIECPFGTLYKTVCARFESMKAPTFPMAGLLVFWGGLQNGFWAFGHNPIAYAKKIDCPTLLLHGAKDEKVSREEIEQIFQNLGGRKKLKIYPKAGHENYLWKYKAEWTEDIKSFLTREGNGNAGVF